MSNILSKKMFGSKTKAIVEVRQKLKIKIFFFKFLCTYVFEKLKNQPKLLKPKNNIPIFA